MEIKIKNIDQLKYLLENGYNDIEFDHPDGIRGKSGNYHRVDNIPLYLTAVVSLRLIEQESMFIVGIRAHDYIELHLKGYV